MTKFGPDTIHVLDCAETNLVQNIRSKAAHQSFLTRQICPLLVPISDREIHDSTGKYRQQLDKELAEEGLIMKHIHSEIGLVYHFGPDKIEGVDRSELVKDGTEDEDMELLEMRQTTESLKQLHMNPETRALIAQLHEKLGDNRPSLFQEDEPQIFFLGTSSMKPGIIRGASAIYVTAG